MNDPLRQRNPRLIDEKFLVIVRTLPCCVCGRAPPSQAAHIRSGNPDYGKPPTGMQEKPSDRWAVPLCGPVMYRIGPPMIGCHAEQHAGNELEFWRKAGKDPFMIADTLYKKFGSVLSERKSRYRKPKPRKSKDKCAKIPAGRKMQSRPFPKVKRKMR
jgi:hypothetical protein